MRPGPGMAAAAGRSAGERRNVEVALTLFTDGWGANPGWEAAWRGMMAPDVSLHFHAQPPVAGIDGAIAFNAGLFAGFPRLAVDVVAVIAEGDEVVVRGRLTGTHDGPFQGVAATGRAVDVPDVTLFTLAGGRVTHMRYYTDLLAVMTAIGAVGPAAVTD